MNDFHAALPQGNHQGMGILERDYGLIRGFYLWPFGIDNASAQAQNHFGEQSRRFPELTAGAGQEVEYRTLPA